MIFDDGNRRRRFFVAIKSEGNRDRCIGRPIRLDRCRELPLVARRMRRNATATREADRGESDEDCDSQTSSGQDQAPFRLGGVPKHASVA